MLKTHTSYYQNNHADMIVVIIILIVLTALFCYFFLFNKELHMQIFRSWNPEGYRLIKEHEKNKDVKEYQTKEKAYTIRDFHNFEDFHIALGPFEQLAGTKAEVLTILISSRLKIRNEEWLNLHREEIIEDLLPLNSAYVIVSWPFDKSPKS